MYLTGIKKTEERIAVEVEMSDALKQIGSMLNFYSDERGVRYQVKDGTLYRMEDISRHGSPIWESQTISRDHRTLEAFLAFEVMLDYIQCIEEKKK